MAVATAKREKPILFSTALVPSVMSGAKTQTRRLLKPRCVIPEGKYEMRCDPMFGKWVMGPAGAATVPFFQAAHGWVNRDLGPLPYQVGDLLYVRETWAEADDEYGGPCLVWAADRMAQHIGRDEAGIDSLCGDSHKFKCDVDRWRPSIHLPKWAARTWLEVVGVKVERLQSISEEDAIAEGCDGGNIYLGHGDFDTKAPSDEFASLWDSLSKPGSQWADNPWVAAYEFRRIER